MTSLIPAAPASRSANGRTRTLHLKIQPESWPWLDQASREINQVWNWANETSRRAVQTYVGPARWLNEFDLNNLASGGAKEFDRINSDMIQRVNGEYVTRRKQFKKVKLRFRASGGAKRALGWIPFKGINLNLRAVAPREVINNKGIRILQHKEGFRLIVAGKTIRLHQMSLLAQAWGMAETEAGEKELERQKARIAEQVLLDTGVLKFAGEEGKAAKCGKSEKTDKLIVVATGEKQKAVRKTVFRPALGSGSFAQNALGEWFLNVSVTVPYEVGTTFDKNGLPLGQSIAPKELVGLDPGLKAVLTTSDGFRYEPNTSYREAEEKLAMLQRCGHKKQAKRLHAKIKNQRMDFTHQISRALVNTYQIIKIGDVSLKFLQSGNHAKSALDSGLGMIKAQLHYKGHWAGRSVQDIDEKNTTRTCSSCEALTGPTGWTGLVVRFWTCEACGVTHDRDVNAAINVARAEESKAPKAKVQKRAKVLAPVRGNKRDCSNPLPQPTPAMGNRDGLRETISS